MQERTLKTLEYDKIIKELTLRANCCVSRELTNELKPYTEYALAATQLELTLQAESVYIRSGYSPIDDFPDIREHLKRLRAVLFLSPKELLCIAKCLKATREARDSLVKETTGNMLLDLAHRLATFDYIEEEINRCILNEDELFDGASPELSRIRKQIKIANEKVKEKLNAIIRSKNYQAVLQDPIITLRNGRYVIPVKQEYRSSVPGLVHDQSGSGQTLFIEPTAVVELGNELKKLQGDEQKEIERILSELTAMIAPYSTDIYNNLLTMGEIDVAFAKAKLAREMSAVCPKLNDTGIIKIVSGRHPLIPKEKVVPIDIWLGEDFTTLIITGPNTGGKTVTLKTVGLFSLMAMSGMFVPAKEGTTLSVFTDVFADIGDEQSIEQSLSTFSSHMKNLVYILNNVQSSDLVLLDELGAGTDPVEGAALAMSILETLHACGSRSLATTHYSEIKAFALSREGMENASMEFDINRLCPTYRLFIGIPGKSNAFEISLRLGLEESVINKAREFLKKEDVKFEDILTSADNSRKIAEREKELAEQARQELFALREQAAAEQKKLEADYEKNKKKAKEEAKRIVTEAKAEAESIIKSLRAVKKNTEITSGDIERDIQKSRDSMRKLEGELSTGEQEEKKEATGKPLEKVTLHQTVHIVSIDKDGVVLSLPDAKGEIQLQVGIMKFHAKLSDLRECSTVKKNDKPKSSVPISKSIGLELDIRGLLVDEAIPIVDRYVEDAYLAGIKEVNIIHGKGTGALRAGIQSFLKGHKRVASYRMGSYGQGDAGVTVVEIRK